MKKFNVYIRTPNKMISYRGRVVRTPVELNGVTESEIGLIRSVINLEAISDYDISEINEKVILNIPNPIGDGREVICDSIYDIIDEKNTKRKTLLEKISDDEDIEF